jgi:plastocyanin
MHKPDSPDNRKVFLARRTLFRAGKCNPQSPHRHSGKRVYNMYMQTDWMRYVWILIILFVLAIIAVLLSMNVPRANTSSQLAPIGFPEYAPLPRAQDAVAVQQGFSALVSFTDNRFEPSTLTIQKGETVRFSNNANTDLRLTSSDSGLFALPASVMPRGYVELTFTEAGTFEYADASSGSSGTVVVE